MLITAQGQTWGISGPVFITLYAIAAIALVASMAAVRRRSTRGHPATAPLDPIEAAYLTGGQTRAIAAAVVALRADGAIWCPGDGRLQAVRTSYTMLTPLTDSVYRALQLDGVKRASELTTNATVGRGLDQVHAGLEQKGLLLTHGQQDRLRLTAVPLVVLLIIGTVRLAAGLQNSSAVGFLVLAMVAVAVMLVVALGAPRLTRAGRAALADIRTAHAHLNPSMSPAWNTYGAAGAALGVGLFGMAAVMSVDPAFAEKSALAQQLGQPAAAATGGASSGGGGCGGGGGDGGGGGCGGGGGGCGGGCGGCGGG